MSNEAVKSMQCALLNLSIASKSNIDDQSVELLDQASALINAAIELNKLPELPPEFGFHLVTAINQLERCQKLCSGQLHNAVFEITARLEHIWGEL